jgi:RNA 3'-terminal phosphate cyclase (ATP)
MIRIDGSYGEGGGQILRTCLGLAAVLRQPFEIYNIRKGRKKPGLQPQHLTGVNAAVQITSARVAGNVIGSLRLVFEPREISEGNYTFNVAQARGSAGSVTLVAQTVLPILFFAPSPSQVTIQGGTHVPSSPVFDYLCQVLLPTIRQLGFNADAVIKTYGFYPVGGGEIFLRVSPQEKIRNDPLRLTGRGKIKKLSLASGVARLPLSIAQRQAERFSRRLDGDCCTVVKEVNSPAPGSYLFLECETENGLTGFSSLGARGKSAEMVADEVFEEFSYYQSGTGLLDPHLADQLLIFLGLLRIPATLSVTRVTSHLVTTIWVLRQFLKNYDVRLTGNLDQPGILTLTPVD